MSRGRSDIVRFNRYSPAVGSFERLEENKTRHHVAVSADVLDLDAFSELARDSIEGFVGMLIRERCPAPFEEVQQGSAQVFVAFAGARAVRVEVSQ